MLDLIQIWAEKFPKGKNSDSTKFKKNYNELVDDKVIMPNEYLFIDESRIKLKLKKLNKDTSPSSTAKNINEDRKETITPSARVSVSGSTKG